ncbi:suppressor of tumorigenicity 14 protein homolog [Puntigrus tetrazona]|uniref:suppressor of tumorigenicity 14 protein homolog n=1 Tax=Puntigrus tetrazona TaxID=1606681 RepID=UPI001C8A0C69|nr:suppressor of tumorigenicity 14 protein homolog [Puntigrus tetrazona]
MELDLPVTFSRTIQTICLPTSTDVFPTGESVTISGWGATREGGAGAAVLQKANVRIINGTVCNELMGGQITSRMTCAGVLSGGVDACQVGFIHIVSVSDIFRFRSLLPCSLKGMVHLKIKMSP